MKEWYAESGRKVYLCGPILPSPSNEAAIANEIKQSPKGAEIQAFLETTLQTSGAKSLLYVCTSALNLIRSEYANVDASTDFTRFLLLAREDTREAMGFPGRCDGTANPFRK